MSPQRTTLSTLVAIAAIALVIGVAIGALIGASLNMQDPEELITAQNEADRLRASVDNAEERIWKLYRQRESLEAQLATQMADSAPDSAQADVYVDGIYIVDADIAPGEYRGEPYGEMGYWARLKNTEGTVYSIIANELVAGPFAVTIVESDKAIELRGVRLEPAE